MYIVHCIHCTLPRQTKTTFNRHSWRVPRCSPTEALFSWFWPEHFDFRWACVGLVSPTKPLFLDSGHLQYTDYAHSDGWSDVKISIHNHLHSHQWSGLFKDLIQNLFPLYQKQKSLAKLKAGPLCENVSRAINDPGYSSAEFPSSFVPMSKNHTTTIQIQHKINTEYNCQNSIQKLPAQKNTNTMTIQYKYNVLHSSFVPICPYVQMLLSFAIVCPNSQSHHHETRKSYFKRNFEARY